jgi:hypothetical protein
VAPLAFEARLNVRAVTEFNVAGNLVNADPGNRLLLIGIALQLLYRRAVLCDREVARHTLRSRRQTFDFAGVGVNMAVFALEPEGDVLLVAERKRLVRDVMFLGGENRADDNQ